MFNIRIGRPLVTLAVGAGLLGAAGPAYAADAPSQPEADAQPNAVTVPATNVTDELYGNYSFTDKPSADAALVHAYSWRP